jgi:hypothetical protein
MGPPAARRASWPTKLDRPDRAHHELPNLRRPRYPAPLVAQIGEPGLTLGIGIISMGLPHDGCQLEHLSPQVLHLSNQNQVLPIRHRESGI